jgi:hypothetical protein
MGLGDGTLGERLEAAIKAINAIDDWCGHLLGVASSKRTGDGSATVAI